MTRALTCEQIARATLGEPTKRAGGELLWHCPNHEDRHESLSINHRKNVFLCGPCNASGTPWQFAAFLGCLDPGDKPGVTAWLKERGLLNGKQPVKAANGRGPCVATYVYADGDGNPLARKLRFEPGANGRKKDFAWQRWEGGAWVDGLAGVKTPLYRLPEITRQTFIVLTEGERDADAGADIDLQTTTSGGTGTFRPEHAEALRRKDVLILVDADNPGREEAQRRATMLHGKAASVRVCEIPGSKDLAEAIERGVPKNVLLALFEETPEWKPAEVREILDSVFGFIRRFVVLTEPQARAVTLWVVHTHAISSAEFTPYMNVTSAEKESGKSRLLEVAAVLVAHAWKTENASPAAIVRKIHSGFEAGEPVTILFDERDSQVGGDKERAETVRGILNSGYERGGSYSRVVGEGTKMGVVDFSTFGAKALAGIGALSDTVASRSIPIRMKRARRGEAEKFRKRDDSTVREAAELKGRLAGWCAANLEHLRDARPKMPEQLSDRQEDCCEPLLAIADLAGDDWPQAARLALVQLCCESQTDDQSGGTRLLADIRMIFDERCVDRLSSADLVGELTAIETSPWAEWSRGRPLTAPKLARLLGRYGIRPGTIRVEGGGTPKGYYVEHFKDAFSRYLPAVAATAPQPA